MKTILVFLVLCFAGLAHANLDSSVAKQLIETRQAALTNKVSAKILSIEDMVDYQGSTLYRVTAEYGGGEQTYQIRYPLKSTDGLTDVLLTSSPYSQAGMAADLKITETELAVAVQMASDAAVKYFKKTFPDVQGTGVYTFSSGEQYGKKPAIILTAQMFHSKNEIPLLRLDYVSRDLKSVKIRSEEE